jgi:uncharacterized membrane protein SirB2
MSLGQGLESSALSQAIKVAGWIIPLVQSIHIITIGVVFVSSLMISLRVFGRMRADEPFPVVWARFAPWMWSGLVVMVITGVLLVLGEPLREFTALSFWLKMTLLVIGVVSTFAFGRTFAPAVRTPPASFSAGAKAAAGGIVVLWLAIIFLGRAIAYDVEVWGKLSLSSHT